MLNEANEPLKINPHLNQNKMKKYLPRVVALLLVTATFNSCKKEVAAVAEPKDYSVSISGKTWSGTLTNAGEGAQYYSVHFNADKTLQWSQFSGDYQGNWLVDKNKLTLTFISPAVIVTADISDDNKLTNITTNTPNKVNTGELVENPNMLLENTIWKGDGNFSSIGPGTLQLSFLSASSVQTKLNSTTYAAGAYTRSASGGVIHFTVPILASPMFCVITPDGTMRGCYSQSKYSWQLSKQ